MAPPRRHQSSPTPRPTKLDVATQQLDTIMGNILRIKRSVTERTISTNAIELECRLDILNSYIEQAMVMQSEIDIMAPSNNSRADLEDLCVSTKSLLLAKLGNNRRPSGNESTFSYPAHRSRLPSMKLPNFSGEYAEYKNFMSLFENLVDHDSTLTDIEKFNHLLSCLSGAALGTVKAYQVTEQNYSKALASLKKVYDNPCLIFYDNITRLFQLPEMHKPSASALRSMVDTVSAIYDSLLSIGDDKCIANAIIIHLVMSKVDSVTRSKWDEQLDYEKLPLWSDCEAALNKRYQHISADEASSSKFKTSVASSNRRPEGNYKKNAKSFTCQANPQQGSQDKCIFCKSTQHYVSACPSFAAIPVQQRFDFIKGVPACINCLKKGHTVTKCKATKCRVCNRSHNTLLHMYATTDVTQISSSPDQPSSSSAAVHHSSSNDDGVILATAVVKIKDKSGQYVYARTLLDSGSQINFVTEELAQRLQLKKEERNLSLIGIGKTNSSAKFKLQATVRSRTNAHEFSSDFWVLRSISKYQPDQLISTAGWDIPKNIELADPYFFKPQKIDMLIGAEIFFELLCVGQMKINPSLPHMQKTLLGWVISGKYSRSKTMVSNSCHVNSISDTDESLDSIVQRFWELEEIPKEATVPSIEHTQCEEHFCNSLQRVQNGRFQVALPFKEDPKMLGLSFDTANRRFLSLERRLSKDHIMKEMYNNFMKEYINLGHMSITDNTVKESPHYFIPHQCVLRPQSSSTKLRVVFDASCKTSTQRSLNDLLMIGPTIQDELYSILLRFRMHKFVVTADIEKMYRQVLIDEANRNFQLILWRENPCDNLEIYKLNTVTYGTSSAPFLAIRCLTYLSEMYKDTLPISAKVIRKDFYVDDLLTGADTIEELKKICSEVTEILQSAGFNLTKWFSNQKTDCELRKNIKMSDDSTKALGTYWFPLDDTFKFKIETSFLELKATKRNILSVSARLFDPLGLLCPLVIRAKVLLQELWLLKLDWDESIPLTLHTAWENFKEDLSKIDTIEIPRHIMTISTSKCQIHGFADASMRAYGCCIYVRSRVLNKTYCRMLTAKSRVAPVKTRSLPRLELCAAHLLAKLWSEIKSNFTCGIESVTFWSDSEITLHWIRSHASTLATFVANRVADIQEFSKDISWRHVPSKENPADIVSRGSSVDNLKSSIWFEGPAFLLRESDQWPVNEHCLSEDQLSLEKRKSSVFLAVGEESNPLLELVNRLSSYHKLLRIFAYIVRFCTKCRKGKSPEMNGTPTAKEMKFSFLKICELIQNSVYREEIKKLSKSKVLPSNLQRLNPFLQNVGDENQKVSLIRVGGRLCNAPIPYDAKFPILMPKNTHFVTIYLRTLHLENCHAGAKALIALLRQQIWLVNAKEECSRIVRSCIHCFHYRPKLMSQIMGNLPADRVRALRPFKMCGVDFCGPVNVTLKLRGRPPIKMYIAVFVCFTSKAVHLELVNDLTSNSFILCLKRFIGRRGLPQKIYSDNATNFVGASRELAELATAFRGHADRVVSFAAQKGIEFAFIPPRAPHFGGLWEAAVKSAKGLLVRTVGNVLLTAEELSTVLVEVEAVLNSRPISPLSNDPNDGEALTPAHLLIGEGLRALPQESHPEEVGKLACFKRWRLICDLRQKFWTSWARDYVRSLQARTKWAVDEPDLDVGKLVVIHDDNIPPLRWKTGRVQAVVHGGDGKVRVAEVRTQFGTLKRPIHKLALLPIY